MANTYDNDSARKAEFERSRMKSASSSFNTSKFADAASALDRLNLGRRSGREDEQQETLGDKARIKSAELAGQAAGGAIGSLVPGAGTVAGKVAGKVIGRWIGKHKLIFWGLVFGAIITIFGPTIMMIVTVTWILSYIPDFLL